MTNASVAALRAEPAVAQKWLPKILGRTYDPTLRPWWEKTSATLGMGMTEPQGGTDVRANTTRAERVKDFLRDHGRQMVPVGADVRRVSRARPGAGRADDISDAALSPGRREKCDPLLPPQRQARQSLQRLVGGAVSRRFRERVGPEGQGVRTIIEMVQMTRLGLRRRLVRD